MFWICGKYSTLVLVIWDPKILQVYKMCWLLVSGPGRHFFASLVSNYDFFVFIRSRRRRMQGLGWAFNIVIVIGSIVEQFIIIFWTWQFALNTLLTGYMKLKLESAILNITCLKGYEKLVCWIERLIIMKCKNKKLMNYNWNRYATYFS